MKRKKDPSAWQAVGFAMGIGFHFVAAIALGIFIGHFTDAFFSFTPWGTLLGILLGFFVAGWSTYKQLVGKNSNDD